MSTLHRTNNSSLSFFTQIQRRAIAEHEKTNAESHLKLACEKLQDFQALSAANTANIKELQAEIFNANERIKELSEIVLKSEGLQELREEITAANAKLHELQRKDDGKTVDDLLTLQSEVNALNKDFKELKIDFSNDKKRLLELQDAVSYGFQDLRGEVAGIKRKQ